MKHILNAVKCLSLLAALLVWSSCTEEMEKGPGKVVEGIPTTVRFAINLPKAEVITTKSLESGTGDDRIDNLYLIAFTADGKYETCEQVQKINDEEVLFHVESGEKYIYAIANASNGVYKDITAWITKDVMGNKMNRETFLTQVVNLQTDNVSNISGAGLMVGGFCLEAPSKGAGVLDIQPCIINPGNDGVIVNSGAIWLQRMRSEVIFNINGNSNFSLTSYEIRNVPRQSALFYSENKNPSNYKEGYFDIKENAKSGQSQFSFYMLENTLKPENSANITNVADREKSGNYPTYSTYVVLKGTYKGESAQPGGGSAIVDATVTYYIHLGKGAGQNAPDYSDFSTYRNKQYIYNITVTGVSSIIAEVEVKGNDDPRAEGDVIIKEGGTILYCDAHYETRVISFNRDEIPTEGLFYTAKTPFGDEDIDWVKFYRNEGEQQDVAANYTDVIRNHSSKLMDVDGLLADLNNWSEEEGEVRYYTCFVNEFFYENRTLSTFVNAEDRTLLIGAKGKFQDINIGNSSVLRGKYTFKQRSIKSIFKLDGDNINPWGIETWNETGKLVFGLNDQGGDLKGGVGKDSDNGYNNQIKFLANINNAWEQAINYSFITESINDSDVPEYNLQPNKGMSPYAFTGAMFACMQRNRDENGNGVIDADEVKWYLPASNQYITLWMGANALKDDATIFDERTRRRSKDNHYYTSTYTNNVYWSEEGITAKGEIPLDKYDLQGVDEWGNDRQYRCVRNLRSNDGVSKIFTVNGSDLLQVRPTNLVDESLRTERLTKEIDSAKGHLLDTDLSNRPYKGGFEYYKNVTVDIFYDQEGNDLGGPVTRGLSFYNNANNYPEKSYCAQYMYKKGHGTGWRMPSQRELALMFMSTSVNGGAAVSRTLHAIVPPGSGAQKIGDGSEYNNLTHTYVWDSGHHLGEVKAYDMKLRCVRDL